MWGSGFDDIWIVGQEGLIVHWDGSTWTPVASGTGASLRRVFGTGPKHAVAVGTGGTILHWDGVSWNRKVSGTSEVLTGVWGTGPANMWAGGWNGTILKWNGATWSALDKKPQKIYITCGAVAKKIYLRWALMALCFTGMERRGRK